MNKCLDIAKKLINEKSLSVDEYEYLIENRTKQIEELLRKEAVKLREEVYGKDIYIRGLIEIEMIVKTK